jgi:UDP-N-acetylglucosamine 2-epimerase
MQIDPLSVVAHKIKFTLTRSALSTQLTALKLFVLTRIVPASFSSPFRAIRVDSNVVQHPVTTEYSKEVENIKVLINSIDKIDNQVIWLWPNVDAGSDIISKEIRTCRESGRLKNVFFAKNFEIEEYASIMKNASVVVGNSSSFIREGSFLGTPAIIVGNRQKNRERGHNVIEVGFIENEIISTLRSQITHGKYKAQNIFGDGSAGRKIVQIIENINFQLQKEMTY